MIRSNQLAPTIALVLALALAGCAAVQESQSASPDPCADQPCDGWSQDGQDADEELAEPSEALAIATPSLPPARRGLDYEVVLETTGGMAPYSFGVVEGELPEGMTLEEDGTLTGRPGTSMETTLVIEVADGSPEQQTATRAFTFVVPPVLLLSGYGPFEGFPVNPSWEAVRVLDGEHFGHLEVRAVSLPVVWDVAPEQLLALADEIEPEAVVASGVAGGRVEAFSLERIAFNVERGTDVEDNRRSGTPVVDGGPAQLESTLPLEAIAEALEQAEVSWAYSDSAGRYLCNHLFYSVVHASQDTEVPAGFIHVSDRNAEVEDLTAGWRVVLQTIADDLSAS